MTPAIIQITPDPIAFTFGPLNIGWYGIGYVVALGALILVTQREVVRRGFDPAHVGNAFLLVLPFAVIGGRLYHVIHEWGACGVGDPCYSQNLARIVLPPYAGLGLYGGIAGGMLAIFIYVRWKQLPLRIALDAVVPGVFIAQGIARWGNFFNQELYGPPTDAPWGIAIDCAHRIAPWFCPGNPRLAPGAPSFPLETTGFHPLFFYESVLDICGGLFALYLAARFLSRLRPGDLASLWFIWYGSTRSVLETFRAGWNWTLGGIATAQWIGAFLVVVGIVWIAWNHRPGSRKFAYLPPWLPPEAPTRQLEEDEADYYAPSELGGDDRDARGTDIDADDGTDVDAGPSGVDAADVPPARHPTAAAPANPDVSPAPE